MELVLGSGAKRDLEPKPLTIRILLLSLCTINLTLAAPLGRTPKKAAPESIVLSVRCALAIKIQLLVLRVAFLPSRPSYAALLFTLVLFLLQESNRKSFRGARPERAKREQHPGPLNEWTGPQEVINPFPEVTFLVTKIGLLERRPKLILTVLLLFTNRIPLAILPTWVGTVTSCVTEMKKTLWSRVLVIWVP